MSERLSDFDLDTVHELIDFFQPLSGKGDVASTNLSSLRQHLQLCDGDNQMVNDMKAAVEELLSVLEVLGVVKACKDTVTYMKQSGLVARLSKQVLQECETRWNSLHTMINSILDVYDEVRTMHAIIFRRSLVLNAAQ